MTDCAPIAVAQAVAAEINTAVGAGALSRNFTAKFSFAEAMTKLEDVNANDGLLVDVLPAMKAGWQIQGQAATRNEVVVKVGLRRMFEPQNRQSDGSIATAEIVGFCNLLYEILRLFSAGVAANSGRELTIAQASWNPRAKVDVQLYDETLLKKLGLYVGWIHLPFVLHEGA